MIWRDIINHTKKKRLTLSLGLAAALLLSSGCEPLPMEDSTDELGAISTNSVDVDDGRTWASNSPTVNITKCVLENGLLKGPRSTDKDLQAGCEAVRYRTQTLVWDASFVYMNVYNSNITNITKADQNTQENVAWMVSNRNRLSAANVMIVD